MDLKKLIYVQDQVLDQDFCNHVIEKFEHDTNRYQGVVSDCNGLNQRVDLTYKNSQDLSITILEDWKKEDDVFCQSFRTHFQNYFTEMSTIGDTSFTIDRYHDLGFIIRKYENDQGYYNWHNDFQLSPTQGIRLLTFIWYLNDVNNGGETEFCDGTLIKPCAGRLLIFPTSWYFVHRGKKPLTGSKYIATAWLYGLNHK